MNDPFERLGALVARRRWWVLGAWLVLLGIAGGALAPKANAAVKAGGFTAPGSESVKAAQILAHDFNASTGNNAVVVFRSTSRTIDDPVYASEVKGASDRLTAVARVQTVTSFLTTPLPSLVSADRHTTIAVVVLQGDEGQVERTVPLLRRQLEVPCWLVWRFFAFYYLPTWDRRIRVLFDWTVWPFIGRDIVSTPQAEGHGVRQVLYGPGQVVIKQGEIGRRLFVIRSGEVEVVREEGARETVLAVLGPGEHFGETAVFENVRRIATVRARTPVELLEMGRDDAYSLSQSVQPFGEELRRVPRKAAAPFDGEVPARPSV